ncbi:MAG: DUF4349 domain-containing protein [Flavobacteriales bacterium]|nr:DUF4349 domain-containing protein [Flavobacteriales bacterium]
MNSFLKYSTALLAFLSFFSCERGMHMSAADEQSGYYAATEMAAEDDISLSRKDAAEPEPTEEATYEANAVDFSEKEPKPEVLIDKSKIIRNAWMQCEMNDYDKNKAGIYQTIERFGAFVSTENEQRNYNQLRNEMEIKVSSSNFDSLLVALERVEGVTHIDHKRTNSEDVGEEYYDLEARIKAKREVEKRYLDILSKARTIKDVLSVEEQLRVIREEIEARQGRLNYLKDRIARSTIYLTVYQNLDFTGDRPDRPGFFNKLASALRGGWNGILNGIIVLGYLWPLWVLLAGVIVFLKRRSARRANKK